ncbi:four helix bundle protein [Candidatus Peregrinibacteria bacterium]|nr:four helix bundle protein [Candidatus Peregrinibacteria bacterium]
MEKIYTGTFRGLIAWQKARDLTLEIYKLSGNFPDVEKFGLSSQIRRASVSVMSNLAEGNQRNGIRDKLNFLNIAYSSLVEVDNQIELAYQLKYISEKEYLHAIELINKTGYLIFRLSESKKNPNNRNNPKTPNNLNKKGFSLVELMIVISIIAIMTVAGVVGFRGSGDTLVVKQVKGIIEDTVKTLELEIIGDEYEKSTMHFLPNFLVVVSEKGDESLDLSLGADCTNGQLINIENDGSLIKRDKEGNPLESKNVSSGTTECIAFNNSSEIEEHYQLSSAGAISPIIRFIHFDVRREKPAGVVLSGDTDETMEISAPYAKKITSDGSIDLVLTGAEGHQENFSIK